MNWIYFVLDWVAVCGAQGVKDDTQSCGLDHRLVSKKQESASKSYTW